MVVYSGNASVQAREREVAKLKEGQFMGEMSYLTESKTNASVVAQTPLRYVSWSNDQLKKFLERNPDLRASLQMILGVGLVDKVNV